MVRALSVNFKAYGLLGWCWVYCRNELVVDVLYRWVDDGCIVEVGWWWVYCRGELVVDVS